MPKQFSAPFAQLLQDLAQLGQSLGDLQDAALALGPDLSTLPTINLTQLGQDASAASRAASVAAAAAAAVANDLGQLPADSLTKINWQNLVCTAIPVYNAVAVEIGWPVLPLPSFCLTPAPEKTAVVKK